MKRAAILLSFCAAALTTAAAEAANQVYTFTTTLSDQVFFKPTIDGVTHTGTIAVTTQGWLQTNTQNALNTKYGSGRLLVTWPTTKSVRIEFVGDWGDAAHTMTIATPYLALEEGGTSPLSGAQYTFVETQAGSAPPPPEEPEEPEEPTPATEETLAAIGEKLDALNVTAAQLLFVAQSIAQTMGLICGGLLWRTIVVAARLK